jgi:hypothetical protein
MSLAEQVKEFCRNDNVGITDINFTSCLDDGIHFVLSKVKVSENIIALYIYPFYTDVTSDNFIMDNLENNDESHFIVFCGFYYKPGDRLYVCEGEYLSRYIWMEDPRYPYKVADMFAQMGKDITESIYNELRRYIPDTPPELPEENNYNCLAYRVFFSGKEPTLSVKKVLSYFPEYCDMNSLERWLADPVKWAKDETDRLLCDHDVADILRQIVIENSVAVAQANLVKKEPGYLWNIINEIYLATKDKKTVIVTVNSKKFKGSFRYDTRGFHQCNCTCSSTLVMDEDVKKALGGPFYVRDITMISYRGKQIYEAKKVET